MDTPSEDLIGSYKSFSKSWATVDEKQDTNPHTHMLIETDCTESIVRSECKQEYGKAGNKKWSCKVVGTGEQKKVLAYMMKEGKVSTHNISKDDIAEAAAINDEIQASKKAKGSMFKRIMDDPQIQGYLETDPPSRGCIVARIVGIFCEAGKTINPNVIVNLTTTVLCKNSKARDALIEALNQRVADTFSYLQRRG